jgi:hypothetical protein
MVARVRPDDPFVVRAGTRWIPRYPDKDRNSTLEIIAVAELANGTNCLVQQVEYTGKNPRRRRLSYKNLLANYREAPID